MKIDIDKDGNILLKEVYCGTLLTTNEGNQLCICMRDDTIEMSVPGSDKWFRVDMSTGDIKEV